MREHKYTLVPDTGDGPAASTGKKKSDKHGYGYYGIPAAVVVFMLLLFAFQLPSGSHRHQIKKVFSFGSDFAGSLFPAVPANGQPIILFWTKFFDADMPYLYDKMEACRNKCFATENRSYLSQSSAVIFHIRDFHFHDLPQHRSPEQLYVFFLMESPPHTQTDLQKPLFKDFFNLTWTYRTDSDIFGSMYMDNWTVKTWHNRTEVERFLRRKLNRAVIFSSNCKTPSHREKYIKELGKHFPVDVLGECGKFSCKKGDKECERKITEKYKFYLAFENSHCKDYLTEKAIRPMNFGTVPVVLGGGNYSAMFPKLSFINSANYAHPAKLADYLWSLTRDFEKYQKLYDWRFDASSTRMPDIANPSKVGMCKLCDLLHNRTGLTIVRHDVFDWWVTKANCDVPFDEK